MPKYHEQYILPNNVIDNDVTSDKSLNELIDEVRNKIQTAIRHKKLMAIIGSHKSQLFDPQKLIVFEIEKID